MAGNGEKKVHEAGGDTFLIQVTGLLWKAGVQLEMGTEYVRVQNIQWQVLMTRQFLYSFNRES